MHFLTSGNDKLSQTQRHGGAWHVQEIATDLLKLKQKRQELGKELKINLEK